MRTTYSLFAHGLATALLVAPVKQACSEGVLARLYSARPPPGSSFVRIVNPQDTSLAVKIAAGPTETLAPEHPASAYVVIAENVSYPVALQGQVSQHRSPTAGAFQTLIAHKRDQAWQYISIEDPDQNADGLKAALRFYNVAQDCPTARVTLGQDGPPVFAETRLMTGSSRTINPVSAKLVAWCGERAASLTLPILRAGDHYSLFLVQGAGALQLVGQHNRTEDYTK